MPSFDVVSEIDLHEVTNAVDQANRELSARFDFKGTDSKFELQKEELHLTTESAFQLQQMRDILHTKLAKRNVDIACLEVKDPELTLKQARQTILFRQGIETAMAKKIVKLIKDQKIKVQASIQGEQVRVTGKNRDDLQQVIALLKTNKFELPLQFNNFRD